MAFNVWQQFIELNGNAAAGASIEVRKMSDNSLVNPLASDSAGSVLGNPFTADSNGFARFYAPAGQYKITATYSGNSFSLTDVLLGDAAGRDIGTGTSNVLDRAAADTLYASVRKYNVSDTAPTVTDDISSGYTAGSQWLRPTSGELYQSFASTAGAADWRLIDTGVSFGTMAVKDEGAGATEFRNNQDAEAYFASQGALDGVESALQADIDGKVTDAPVDGKAYARKDAAWTEVTMGGAGDVEEAPNDGQPYARKNEAWVKSADAKTALSTGIIGNVATSINADPAKIDVSFDGAVFSDIANGTYKTVGATNLTAVTVTGLASRDLSYFAVDSTGSIVFQGTDFTALQRRDFAKIGVVFHPNRTTITSVTLNPIGADDVGGLVNDYFESIPPLNITGNLIEPAGTDRSIKRTAGKVFGLGANAANSIKSKHILTTPEANPATFFTNWRASGGTGVMFGSGTQIDFTKWDNASGTLQTTSGKKTTVKRVYLFPQSLTLSIMYGQRIYDDFDKAIAGYLSNSFEQRNDVSSGIFLGWIIAQADTTNIAAAITANKARIIPASSASAGGTGAGFDPAAAQTITGQWTFDISGGKSFYATDDPTLAAPTKLVGILDRPSSAPDRIIMYEFVANPVSGDSYSFSTQLPDSGGAVTRLILSGTTYMTISSATQSFELNNLPTHADEAAAVTAGLATDTVYKTATGELRIKL